MAQAVDGEGTALGRLVGKNPLQHTEHERHESKKQAEAKDSCRLQQTGRCEKYEYLNVSLLRKCHSKRLIVDLLKKTTLLYSKKIKEVAS